jgi:CheY-like chemotaxis protein
MAASHEGTIDLLVTDVVMPGLGGREVARGVRDLYPQIRVLYISGYTDEVVAFQIELEAGSAFLQKPFTPSVLGHKVREVLDAD